MKRRLLPVVVLVWCLTAGCSSVDAGDATVSTAPPDSNYPCGLAGLDTAERAVGGSSGYRVVDGSLCEWHVEGPRGPTDVVFAWFVDGSLDRERRIDGQLGYVTTDIKVAFRKGIAIRTVADPNSCGAAADTDSGVIQWWIHYRSPDVAVDPCADAHALSVGTLDLEP